LENKKELHDARSVFHNEISRRYGLFRHEFNNSAKSIGEPMYLKTDSLGKHEIIDGKRSARVGEEEQALADQGGSSEKAALARRTGDLWHMKPCSRIEERLKEAQHFSALQKARVGWSLFHSFNVEEAKQHMSRYAQAYNTNNQKQLDVEQSWLHEHNWHISPQITGGITTSWNLYNEYDTTKKGDFNFPNPSATADSGSKITTKA
jgi:hypothetical protein